MIAVFSAYREPPGEWESRLETATLAAKELYAGEPFCPVGAHTREEAEMMVAECIKRGHSELVVVTSASHAKRAVLTVLKVLLDGGLDRQIELTHRVSLPNLPLSDIDTEAAKIHEYQARGHVATVADWHDYTLRWFGRCAI